MLAAAEPSPFNGTSHAGTQLRAKRLEFRVDPQDVATEARSLSLKPNDNDGVNDQNPDLNPCIELGVEVVLEEKAGAGNKSKHHVRDPSAEHRPPRRKLPRLNFMPQLSKIGVLSSRESHKPKSLDFNERYEHQEIVRHRVLKFDRARCPNSRDSQWRTKDSNQKRVA